LTLMGRWLYCIARVCEALWGVLVNVSALHGAFSGRRKGEGGFWILRVRDIQACSFWISQRRHCILQQPKLSLSLLALHVKPVYFGGVNNLNAMLIPHVPSLRPVIARRVAAYPEPTSLSAVIHRQPSQRHRICYLRRLTTLTETGHALDLTPRYSPF